MSTLSALPDVIIGTEMMPDRPAIAQYEQLFQALPDVIIATGMMPDRPAIAQHEQFIQALPDVIIATEIMPDRPAIAQQFITQIFLMNLSLEDKEYLFYWILLTGLVTHNVQETQIQLFVGNIPAGTYSRSAATGTRIGLHDVLQITMQRTVDEDLDSYRKVFWWISVKEEFLRLKNNLAGGIRSNYLRMILADMDGMNAEPRVAIDSERQREINFIVLVLDVILDVPGLELASVRDIDCIMPRFPIDRVRLDDEIDSDGNTELATVEDLDENWLDDEFVTSELDEIRLDDESVTSELDEAQLDDELMTSELDEIRLGTVFATFDPHYLHDGDSGASADTVADDSQSRKRPRLQAQNGDDGKSAQADREFWNLL